MLKKIITVLFLFTIIFSDYAQNSAAGIFVGGNNYNLSNFSEDIDVRSKFGAQFGLNFQHFFKNNLFIQAQLGAVEKGHKIVKEDIGSLSDSNGIPMSAFDTEVKSNFIYISSSVAIGYRFILKNDHFLSVSVAASPNFLLTAKSKVSTNSLQIEPGKVELDHVEKFDFSGLFDLGYTVPINNKFSLNMILNYSKGFLPVFEQGVQEDLRSLHNGFSLNFGLNYSFGSN